MKEKLGIFIVSVLCAIACSLIAVGLAAENNWLPAPKQMIFDEGDSIKVAQVYEQLQSPRMYTYKDVLDLQEQMLDKSTTDELFMSMTPDVIRPVVSVLLKTEGVVTKESIVKEYRANDGIYNNLPVESDTTLHISTNAVDLGATDLGNRSEDKLISSSLKRRTDTVNGKPVKIVTETKESYE